LRAAERRVPEPLPPGSGAAFGMVAAVGYRGAALPGDAVDHFAPRVP